jgi:hypothetical protein
MSMRVFVRLGRSFEPEIGVLHTIFAIHFPLIVAIENQAKSRTQLGR